MVQQKNGQVDRLDKTNDNDNKEDSADDDEGKKQADGSKDVCSECKIEYAKDEYGQKYCVGCTHLWKIFSMHEMGSNLGQCYQCKGFGPAWH
jgi:hypothetical protein